MAPVASADIPAPASPADLSHAGLLWLVQTFYHDAPRRVLLLAREHELREAGL